MFKIKNFIYNVSDIIVALVIIAVITLIIAWRVDAIMNYPQEQAAQISQNIQTDEQENKSASSDKAADDTDNTDTDSNSAADVAPDASSQNDQTQQIQPATANG